MLPPIALGVATDVLLSFDIKLMTLQTGVFGALRGSSSAVRGGCFSRRREPRWRECALVKNV